MQALCIKRVLFVFALVATIVAQGMPQALRPIKMLASVEHREDGRGDLITPAERPAAADMTSAMASEREEFQSTPAPQAPPKQPTSVTILPHSHAKIVMGILIVAAVVGLIVIATTKD